MSTYLKIGSFTFDTGECGVRPMRKMTKSGSGIVSGFIETWSIWGRVQAADTAAVLTALALREAVFSAGTVGDVVLYTDANAATHQRLVADTIGGIRVSQPMSYPIGAGAELSTFRNWEAELECEVRNSGGLVDWIETVTRSGGGDSFVVLEPLNGSPIMQPQNEQTAYHALQEGQALGQFTYIEPPPPIWPDQLHKNLSWTRKTTPRLCGSSGRPYIEYPTSWHYEFESDSPFSGGNPTAAPGTFF